MRENVIRILHDQEEAWNRRALINRCRWSSWWCLPVWLSGNEEHTADDNQLLPVLMKITSIFIYRYPWRSWWCWWLKELHAYFGQKAWRSGRFRLSWEEVKERKSGEENREKTTGKKKEIIYTLRCEIRKGNHINIIIIIPNKFSMNPFCQMKFLFIHSYNNHITHLSFSLVFCYSQRIKSLLLLAPSKSSWWSSWENHNRKWSSSNSNHNGILTWMGRIQGDSNLRVVSHHDYDIPWCTYTYDK